eukprot:700148-Amphidinium_carterae.2
MSGFWVPLWAYVVDILYGAFIGVAPLLWGCSGLHSRALQPVFRMSAEVWGSSGVLERRTSEEQESRGRTKGDCN